MDAEFEDLILIRYDIPSWDSNAGVFYDHGTAVVWETLYRAKCTDISGDFGAKLSVTLIGF